MFGPHSQASAVHLMEAMMRSTLTVAAAAFVAGALSAGAVLAVAAPQGAPGDVPPPPREAMAMGPHGPGPFGGPDHAGGPMQRLRNFALIYRQTDRALSPADVQKIAEAFLLWHGNHSWKITDVAQAADGLVAFSIASPEGFVIAKFTMNPHTAKLNRIA